MPQALILGLHVAHTWTWSDPCRKGRISCHYQLREGLCAEILTSGFSGMPSLHGRHQGTSPHSFRRLGVPTHAPSWCPCLASGNTCGPHLGQHLRAWKLSIPENETTPLPKHWHKASISVCTRIRTPQLFPPPPPAMHSPHHVGGLGPHPTGHF